MHRTLRDALIDQMKRVNHDGADTRRIEHALAVLAHAEAILAAEPGDPDVVIPAAILHDIGIAASEEKYGSAAGHHQEVEGPPIARQILKARGVDAAVVDHVCKIIANHHCGRNVDTPEFRIIWDADWLVNLPEEFPDEPPDRRAERIQRIFRTHTGAARARELLL